MSAFITQAIESNPQVLVLSCRGALQTELTDFLHSKNLDVVSVDILQEIEEGRGERKLEELKKHEFYKIFWIIEDLVESEKILHLVAVFLQDKQALSTLITYQHTQLLSTEEKLLRYLQRTAREQELLLYLIQVLPTLKVIFGQDVWLNDQSLIIQQLLAVIGGTTESNATFVPLAHQDFIQVVKKHVLQPRLAQLTKIQGKETSLTQFFERLTALRPDLQKIAFEVHNAKEKFEVDKVFTESSDLSDLLEKVANAVLKRQEKKESITPVVTPPKPVQQKIKTLNVQENLFGKDSQLQPEPKMVTKTPLVLPSEESTKRHVIPHEPPKIENRLKKYEEKVEQAHKEKELQRYLRPVDKDAASPENIATKSKEDIQVLEKHIEQNIQQVFGLQRTEQKVVRLKKKAQVTVKTQKKQHIQKKLWRAVLGMGIIGVMIGFLFFGFAVNRRLVFSSLAQTFSGELEESAWQEKQLVSLGKVLGYQVDLYKMFLGREALPESNALAIVSVQTAEIKKLVDETQVAFSQVADQALDRKQGDVFASLVELSSKNQNLYKKLSYLQYQLNALHKEFLPETQRQHFEVYASQLQEYRKLSALGEQFQQLLPSLLAQNGRKTYALVLQNSLELRATGGVPHALVLITLEKGVVVDHQILEVAALDNTQKGEVKPPDEVTQVLGQKQWFLRDATWSPNFSESGKNIAVFVERSTGRKIDGVIGINVLTLKDFLKTLGPLELPEYQEVITDKNILERIEFHSEIDVLQSGKQDYLTTLFNKTFNNILAANSQKTTQVFGDLYSGIVNGQVLLYVSDESENATLLSMGWGGDVAQPNCPAQLNDVPCIVDTLMQVENNIGVNKANHFIDRSISHTITVGKIQAHHERVITYRNLATSNSWPSGTYRNYVRLYVPVNSKIESVVINNQVLPIDKLVIQQEQAKKYFGFQVEVPIQKTVTVKVTYTASLQGENTFSYAFFDQKQAGTKADPEQVTVVPEDGLQPLVIAPQGKISGKKIQFDFTRDKHLFVGVKLH